MRRRRLPVPKGKVLAGRRVYLSRLAVRSTVAFLLLVLAMAVLASVAPTAALYFGVALVVLSLPVVIPYLVIRGVVAAIDR